MSAPGPKPYTWKEEEALRADYEKRAPADHNVVVERLLKTLDQERWTDADVVDGWKYRKLLGRGDTEQRTIAALREALTEALRHITHQPPSLAALLQHLRALEPTT